MFAYILDKFQNSFPLLQEKEKENKKSFFLPFDLFFLRNIPFCHRHSDGS